MTPTQKLILKDLADGYATAKDLSFVLNLTRDHITKVLRQLYAGKLVRIAAWEHCRERVWGLKNNQADAPKPKRKHRAGNISRERLQQMREASARWRARHPEKHREAGRRQWAKNRERGLLKQKLWREQNREHIREYKRRRAAILKAQNGGSPIQRSAEAGNNQGTFS